MSTTTATRTCPLYSPHRPHPGILKAILGLWLAIDGLEDLSNEDETHFVEADAGPTLPQRADGLLFTIRMYTSLLQGSVANEPKAFFEWDGAAFPPAVEIARIMEAMDAATAEADAPLVIDRNQ